MDTHEFPYHKFGFDRFNKVQAAVIPYADKDVNLVVSSPTATGKSAIAEAAFGYHLSQEQGKVVYVSPYRSLSHEKHEGWRVDGQFVNHGIVISTGDHLATRDEFEAGRMILLTIESFDSKTRNEHHYSWLRNVCCLCVDESHLIGQKGRGDALEMSLMRFTRLNPAARIILLSATMANVGSVAEWLKSLNGKETIKIRSTWRPARVETHLYPYGEDNSWNEQIRLAAELVRDADPSEKIIVFVHSKKLGKEVLKSIRASGKRCAFHNASVSRDIRKKIEAEFNDQSSGFNVIVSTSTLSSGVNLG